MDKTPDDCDLMPENGSHSWQSEDKEALTTDCQPTSSGSNPSNKDINIHSTMMGWGGGDVRYRSLLYLLIFLFLVFYPRSVLTSGIGFRNFDGNITVRNSTFDGNTTGIQFTITNEQSAKHIWIDSNTILNSVRDGIKIDLGGALPASIPATIENNTLDNSNVASNGYFGIWIKNELPPSPIDKITLKNNTIKYFGRSGIAVQGSVDTKLGLVATGNTLQNNGTQDYEKDGDHFASGLQAKEVTFLNITDNLITSNRFSGIAASGSVGTIGPNNVIKYDGDPGLAALVGSDGSIADCVLTPGSLGNTRGGILVEGLQINEEVVVDCNNTIENNYWMDVAYTGSGNVLSCGEPATSAGDASFFASAASAVYFFQGPTSYNLDCNTLPDNTIDATGKPFGVLITGSDADVTVQNCTIKNAAMDLASAASTGEDTIIGAGIFISLGAEPLIRNNYITGNGWGLLDDKITSKSNAGILMRCVGNNASILNNTIVSNLNDGLRARQSGGVIGALSLGNIFRNNGRNGIGLFDGNGRQVEIAYNTISDNQRGIGAFGFDDGNLLISHNLIASNRGARIGGGIGVTASNMTVSITENTIRNNTSITTVNQGVAGIGVTDSTLANTWTIADNYIHDNTLGYMGGIGFHNLRGSPGSWVSILNNTLVGNGWGQEGNGALVGGIGNIGTADSVNWWVEGNTISNNTGLNSGAFGIRDSGGELTFRNNIVKNNLVYDSCTGGGCPDSYMGPGLGLRDSTTSLYVYDNIFSGNDVALSGGDYIGGAVGLYWTDTFRNNNSQSTVNLTLTGNSILENGHGGLTIWGSAVQPERRYFSKR